MSIDRLRPALSPHRVVQNAPARPPGALPGAFLTRSATAPPAPAPTIPTTPLARLKAGEVDADGYRAAKIDAALAPLRGLGPAETGRIRAYLDAAFQNAGPAATLLDQVTRALGGST